MVGEALAALGGLKSAFDTVKAIKEMNDTHVRNTAVADVLEKLLTAREQYATLLDRVSELEGQLKHFQAWDADKQRYKLTQFVPGMAAYLLKRSMANGEPAHALCPNCFQRGVKSFLQFNGTPFLNEMAYDCGTCKMKLTTGGATPTDFADE